MLLDSGSAQDSSRVGYYALYLAVMAFGYLIWLTIRLNSLFKRLEERIARLETKGKP